MKKKILIIVAAIAVPFLALLVLFYFLYPHLNEEKYEQILSEIGGEQKEDPAPDEIDYDEITFNERPGDEYTFEDYENLPNNLELLMAEQNNLQNTIDSLNREKQILVSELDELSSTIDSAQTVEIAANEETEPLLADANNETREEFSERVKSLMNLEEEQLAPIVKQLSDEQLIRLYYSAGNIQREKLLRSLSAARAAKLMEKIML